jgi:environmental stress-induced protein Ves
VRIVRRADCVTRPWKNGGGIAHRIAISPPDAESDFAWQANLAEISADGPFSHYPGIDRHFVIAAGNGVELKIVADDVAFAQEVRPLQAPFAFRGDWSVHCRLLDGPTRAFNILTRRGRVGASVQIAALEAMTVVRKAANEQVVLFFPRGAVNAHGTWGSAELGADDAIVMDETEWNEVALAPIGGPLPRYITARLATP